MSGPGEKKNRMSIEPETETPETETSTDETGGPEFESPEEQELFSLATLGEKGRDFAMSEIGRWVIGCAVQDRQEIGEKLLTIDPHDTKGIITHQIEAGAAGKVLEYVEDAINRGETAYQQLRANNETEEID